MGAATYYGAVLEISTLPILDFEFQANYLTQKFDYTFSVGGVPTTTSMDFNDFSVVVMAKKNLVPVPMSPVSLYIGAGPGWHLLSTEVVRGVAGGTIDPKQADDPVSLFNNTSKMSFQGMAGLKIAPPVFPLALFGEFRYGAIFATETLRLFEIEGGLMIKF